MTIWDDIADERRILADELDRLDDDQWEVDSLCEGWTVKEVVAHLTTVFHFSMAKFGLSVITSGGFDNAMRKMAIREAAEHSTGELVESLRANAEHRFTPPGLGPEAPLTDVVLHGEDIRRPLGTTRVFPERVSRPILDLLANKYRPARTRRGVSGLRFVATDIDWSTGSGPTVTGPAEALMMSIGGRMAALDDLAGDGLDVFAGRF